MTPEQLRSILGEIRFPGFSRDLVSLGVIRDLQVDQRGKVRVVIDPGPTLEPALARQLAEEARARLEGLPGISGVEVAFAGAAASPEPLRVVPSTPSVAARGSADPELIPGVRQTVAVASGKGGVGKSTVAVNLAVALARQGAKVGLLDADIYGPSIPMMTGLRGVQPVFDEGGRRLLPFERFDVRLMSLGFLVDPESAVIWRGPMVMKALEQLLRDVAWGELDLLMIDLPPGTGDAQLTLSQRLRLSGAVIVTTPQDVALADAIKGVAMFRKVQVPILGIVENMSYLICPHCSKRSEVFGHGGGREQASRLGVPFLGEVPLDPAIRVSGDEGKPVTAADPDSLQSKVFAEIAARVRRGLEQGAS